jgi:hypothetical protein
MIEEINKLIEQKISEDELIAIFPELTNKEEIEDDYELIKNEEDDEE